MPAPPSFPKTGYLPMRDLTNQLVQVLVLALAVAALLVAACREPGSEPEARDTPWAGCELPPNPYHEEMRDPARLWVRHSGDAEARLAELRAVGIGARAG